MIKLKNRKSAMAYDDTYMSEYKHLHKHANMYAKINTYIYKHKHNAMPLFCKVSVISSEI